MSTETAEQSIELVVQHNPSIVLLDKEKASLLFDHIEREVRSFVPDLTTEKGRKNIASLAYKVGRTKTAIDEAGKLLKSEYKKKTDAIDAERRLAWDKLEAIQEEARKPLTEWETAEAERVATCQRDIAALEAARIVTADATAEKIQAILTAVEETDVDDAIFQDLTSQALSAKRLALEVLTAALARIKQAEIDKAELARLRAEAAAREESDRIAAKAAEEKRQAEVAAEQKRLDEERRVAAEEARLKAATEAAEAKARAEAERVANEAAIKAEAERRVEADRIAAEHQAELDRIRAANQEADRKAQEEIRIANEQREALLREQQAREAAEQKAAAEAKQKAAAEAKLLKDKTHRASVLGSAVSDIQDIEGITGQAAIEVIGRIAAGKVRAVSINFLQVNL